MTPNGDAARIVGELTIRGTIRPVTLQAQFTLSITGAIRRSAFGADGCEGIVGAEVMLAILARRY